LNPRSLLVQVRTPWQRFALSDQAQSSCLHKCLSDTKCLNGRAVTCRYRRLQTKQILPTFIQCFLLESHANTCIKFCDFFTKHIWLFESRLVQHSFIGVLLCLLMFVMLRCSFALLGCSVKVNEQLLVFLLLFLISQPYSGFGYFIHMYLRVDVSLTAFAKKTSTLVYL